MSKVCESCGEPLPEDDEGDGAHLEDECIENLQEDIRILVAAAVNARMFLKVGVTYGDPVQALEQLDKAMSKYRSK